MPKYFTDKEEKMYGHIKESVGGSRAKEIAARTVNKYRAKKGHTTDAKKSVDNEILNTCMTEVLDDIEKGHGIPIEEADEWKVSSNPGGEMDKSFEDIFTDEDLQKSGDNPRMAEQNAGYESSNSAPGSGQAPRSAVGEKTVQYNPHQAEQTQDGSSGMGKADYSRVGNEGSNKPASTGQAPRSSVGAKTVQYNPHQSSNVVEKSGVVLPTINERNSSRSLMTMSKGTDEAVAKRIDEGLTSQVPTRNLQLEGAHNRDQQG